MSAPRVILGLCVVGCAVGIFYVHGLQSAEQERMHAGVLRDMQRVRDREARGSN